MSDERAVVPGGSQRRRWLYGGLIGCGALIAVCLVLGIAVAIFVDDDDDPDIASGSGDRQPTAAIGATSTKEASSGQSGTADEAPTSPAGVSESSPTEALAPTPQATDTVAPTDTPEPTPTAEPTPTPGRVGSGRSNPVPLGEVGQTDEWEVQVLEVLRGDLAWERILGANQFNDPAPEGYEYVLINVRVKYIGDEIEAQRVDSSWFRSTGDARVKHSRVYVVEPEPVLDVELFAGAEASGWTTVLARQGEGNMMAIFEPLISFEEGDELFLALDEGANVQPLEERLAEENDLGFDRHNPVPLGERVVGDTWELWVIEAIRGDEALRRVKDANMFNEDPAEGMEYVIVRIGARNVKPDAGSDSITEFSFKATGDAGRVYDRPTVVDPEPVLDYDVYAGGEVDGWVTVQVAAGEQNIRLAYEPLFSLTAKPRYFALE